MELGHAIRNCNIVRIIITSLTFFTLLSRSCSGTRRRCGLNEEEDVAKTIITIGPGKPTRIREHSPSKKSPTTEQPPTTFENLNEEKEVMK